MNTVVKSTPGNGITWYIKWIANAFILIGGLLTANDVFPLNLYFSAPGMLGWFIVAMVWQDRALQTLNVFMLALALNSLFRELLLPMLTIGVAS